MRRVRPHVAALAFSISMLVGCAYFAPESKPLEEVEGAEPGTPDEAYRLALRLFEGVGAPHDEARALALIGDAAEAGHAEAQFMLAELHAEGIGVAREPAWAAMWHRRAALRGHVEAQYRLAVASALGEGMSVDLIEAYMWLSVATAAGHETAARRRAALAGRMIRQEIAPASRAAAAWTPLQEDAPDLDGPLVRFVQFALARLGHGAGPVDGTLGRRTRQALRAFARREALGSDIDTPTRAVVERLRERLRALDDSKARIIRTNG